MKRTIVYVFVVVALFSMIPGYSYGVDVQWPQNPVVGVIGASFEFCGAPVDSPYQGMGFAGCSHEALSFKLTKNHHLDKLGLRVQTAAQGGARSYDITGTGWHGYLTQYKEIVARTTWLDGPRLKYLVVGMSNDCLHTVSCTEQEMTDITINNIKQVVDMANQSGVQLFIYGYPDWEDLDLNLTAQVLWLTNIIDEASYRRLQQLHESELSLLPGVHYMKVWQNNFDAIDGLHPSDENLIRAAEMISLEIKELEKK